MAQYSESPPARLVQMRTLKCVRRGIQLWQGQRTKGRGATSYHGYASSQAYENQPDTQFGLVGEESPCKTKLHCVSFDVTIMADDQ